MSKKPSKRRAQRLAFAQAYGDPKSPTFNQPVPSYFAVFPDATPQSAERGARKMLTYPEVQEELNRLADEAQAVVGMKTVAEYIQECLDREEQLFAMLGATEGKTANAMAKYREMAGKAMGAFVIRTEDLTPPERRQLTSGQTAEIVEQMFEKLERYRRISAPLPVPAPPRAPAITAQVAEEVEEVEVEEVDDAEE